MKYFVRESPCEPPTEQASAWSVGVVLPNGMRVELRARNDRDLALYTPDGRLLVDLRKTAANVVGVLPVKDTEELEIASVFQKTREET